MQITFEAVEQHLNKLIDVVVDIDSRFKILSDLYSALNGTKRKEVINGYSVFYGNVFYSFWKSIIIDLDIIFDKCSKRGIFKLNSRIKQCISMSKIEEIKLKKYKADESLKYFINNIDKYHKLLESIKTQRDEYWADTDPKYFDFPEKLTEDTKITIGDLNSLVEFAKSVMRSFYSSVCNISIDMRVIDTEQAMRMIDLISENYDLKKELSDLDAKRC